MCRVLGVCLLIAMSAPVFALDFASSRFAVYRGDTNSDGDTDLYLRRKPDVYLIGGDAMPLPLLLAQEEAYDKTDGDADQADGQR